MKNKLSLILLVVTLLLLGFVFAENFFSGLLWKWVFAAVFCVAGIWIFHGKVKEYSFSKSFLILVFLLVIFIPFAGKKQNISLENRKLAPFPEWRWSNIWQFFFQYQVYFDDRFAYRNELVAAVNKIKIKIFHKSAIPDQVAIGDEDWLYMARKDYIVATSRPFTEQQLDTVILNLEVITRFFDSKGMKFYFMMLPVKERIYPEFLPELQRVEMKISKMDQLYARLINNKVIRSIDCKQELLNGKKVKDTYYKPDTHWNMFGAYLGYRKLIARLNADFPELQAHNPEDYQVDSVMQYEGDLQKMMGFVDVFQMKSYTYKLKSGIEAETISFKNPKYPNAHFSTKQMPERVSGLRLYLVRDSFSEHLKVFLTAHFDYSALAWMPVLPVNEILAVSPNLVVHEIHELFANHLLKLPDEILQDTVFVKNYQKTYKIK
ncbi:MAG: hypothetical protein M3Q95_15155 [Bacteroidota bacterium]|nr:hypothetical protein [Bacteroidota bacterium]